jgi:uncharacterized FlaG/YvyC family protein
MAETGFNPSPVAAVSSAENRETFAERPRDEGQRVEPAQRPDQIAEDERSPAQRAAEIERLVSEALKTSKLRILKDQDSGDFVYLMIDSDTGETVRRWPPEKHTDLMEYLRTQTAGLLDKKA